MLNFAEQTGSGAVMLVWSFLPSQRRQHIANGRNTNDTQNKTKTNTKSQQIMTKCGKCGKPKRLIRCPLVFDLFCTFVCGIMGFVVVRLSC